MTANRHFDAVVEGETLLVDTDADHVKLLMETHP